MCDKYYCATCLSYQCLTNIFMSTLQSYYFVCSRVLHGRTSYVLIQQFLHLCTTMLVLIFIISKKLSQYTFLFLTLRTIGWISLKTGCLESELLNQKLNTFSKFTLPNCPSLKLYLLTSFSNNRVLISLHYLQP